MKVFGWNNFYWLKGWHKTPFSFISLINCTHAVVANDVKMTIFNGLSGENHDITMALPVKQKYWVGFIYQKSILKSLMLPITGNMSCSENKWIAITFTAVAYISERNFGLYLY